MHGEYILARGGYDLDEPNDCKNLPFAIINCGCNTRQVVGPVRDMIYRGRLLLPPNPIRGVSGQYNHYLQIARGGHTGDEGRAQVDDGTINQTRLYKPNSGIYCLSAAGKRRVFTIQWVLRVR